MTLPSFNPLLSVDVTTDEVLQVSRRTLQNVTESYHRTYDVFAELIQNAVDAVYQRAQEAEPEYVAKVWVDLDLTRNRITVCDNGIGISADQFRRVLAPNVSFKDHRTSGSKRYRGHKGVGLAFLAYGFNYIRVSSRTSDGSLICGVLEHGRRWVSRATEAAPTVEPADEQHEVFIGLTRGTAVTVQLDETTTPRSLPHIATSLDAWAALLRVQTALGRVFFGDGEDLAMEATLTIRREGSPPQTSSVPTTFLYPHRASPGTFKYLDLNDYYKQNPEAHRIAPRYRLRDGIYVFWDTKELVERLGTDESVKSAKEILTNLSGWAYGFMAYSSEFWTKVKPEGFPFTRLIEPGVAIASDAMVIGDAREISLTRYIGRQQQVHCVVHLDGLRPDLGRKSFERVIEDAAQRVAQRLVAYFGEHDRFRDFLRASPTKTPPGTKEKDLQDWVIEATRWATERPLRWGEHQLPLRSEPQQEQDVVILFSQLVACGLLPGYALYSTGETNRQYDCILRVVVGRDDVERFSPTHPEGLEDAAFHNGRINSKALVLEFKHSLSDLISDLLDETKFFKDIDVAVAWELGPRFTQGIAGEYELRTVSTDDTINQRPYPGITHRMVRQGSEDQIWVVVLSDLFQLANDFTKGVAHQMANYPE